MNLERSRKNASDLLPNVTLHIIDNEIEFRFFRKATKILKHLIKSLTSY